MSKDLDKIRELLGQNLMRGSDLLHKQDRLRQERESGQYEIDRYVPGEIIGDDASGRFYLVRNEFPLDTVQGPVELGAIFNAASEHIALAACDPNLDAFDPATALFLDVETTGLAGGTGTVPFLIGVGYFTNDAFRLEQTFMRDFDEEEAMLRYLEPIFARAQTVVTFNGKTFDVPLLRSRFITSRLPFRLDNAMHFDLVHAARRIWKLRIRDCSLGNVERQVLHIHRHGDVPGAEIPQIWFDYLRSRDARKLPGVFYHHRMDILSLVALTALIAERLDVPCGEGFEHVEDRLSLVRLHFRQKKFEQTLQHARHLLESEVEPIMRHQGLCMLALAAKRLQDWAAMEQAWTLMLEEFPRDILPRLELAKHYEHRKRNLPRALSICEQAVEYLQAREKMRYAGQEPSPECNLFIHRAKRIRRKMDKYAIHDEPEDLE